MDGASSWGICSSEMTGLHQPPGPVRRRRTASVRAVLLEAGVRARERERYLRAQGNRRRAERARIAGARMRAPRGCYLPRLPTNAELAYMTATRLPWIPKRLREKLHPAVYVPTAAPHESFGRWIGERCVFNDGISATMTELFLDYSAWVVEGQEVFAYGFREFCRQVRRAFKVTSTRGQLFARGVAVRN